MARIQDLLRFHRENSGKRKTNVYHVWKMIVRTKSNGPVLSNFIVENVGQSAVNLEESSTSFRSTKTWNVF